MVNEESQAPAVPTILVVEDDADTREFFVDLLISEGYQVRSAATGRAALAQLQEGPLEAVALDVRLPDTDGFTLCLQIRARMPATLPILIVTANLDPRMEAQAREAGATGLLTKPFPPEVLLDRIATLTHRRNGQGTHDPYAGSARADT